MNARFLSPLVVAAVVMLAGSSGTPALADNTAATYHQIALITVPGNPLTSFDISIVERSSQTDDEDDRSSNTDDRGDRSSKSDERSNQTYFLADRSNKAVDIFNASSSGILATTARVWVSISDANGGASASLAMRISLSFWSYASSSARAVPPVEIDATIVSVRRSMTFTVLSPSPAQSSWRSRTPTIPSGPEVSLLPVKPTKPATRVSNVFDDALKISTALFERSARK